MSKYRPEYQDESSTPLHIAISQGETKTALQLITDESVDLNVVDKQGKTPLIAAVKTMQLDYKNLLGRLLHSKERLDKFKEEVITKYRPIIQALLKKGAQLDIVDEQGRSALYYSIPFTEVMRDLLEPQQYLKTYKQGADPNRWIRSDEKSEENPIPLLAAVQSNSFDAVKLLLGHKADPNAKGYNGSSALHLATVRNNAKMVGALLEAGADFSARLGKAAATRDFIGYNRSSAERYHYEREVTITDATPLHTAVLYSDNNADETIKALLNKGADLHAKTEEGLTAFALACIVNDDKACVALLHQPVSFKGVTLQGWLIKFLTDYPFYRLPVTEKTLGEDLERLAQDIIGNKDNKPHPQHEDIRLAAVEVLRQITLNQMDDPQLSDELLSAAVRHRVFSHTSKGVKWLLSSNLTIPQQRLERAKIELSDRQGFDKKPS